jgi:CubicO group peptidase (beta-lactamase class C family)
MRILKGLGLFLLLLLVLLNAYILISGRTYLYKGIVHTYLKGRSGPSITEFEIFHNRTVKTGNPVPWLISDRKNEKEIPTNYVKDFLHYETTSYLIIKNDSIVYEQYWEDFNPSTLSNSFSMAKTIVSVLIGAALKEGKIQDLNEPVWKYLPEFKEGDRSKITIKDVLTMSSGIDFDEHYASPLAYPAQAYYGDNLRELTMQYYPNKEPGKLFEYLSGNSQLLAFILEAATGKKISEYASEKLWIPMGAEYDAFWNLDAENRDEKAFCCFVSNARDFARFGKLFLNKGNWKGHQIVDTSYAEASVRLNDMLERDGSTNNKYGYAWWILPEYKGLSIFYMRGILGQYVIAIPEKNMIIVRLGRKRAPKSNDNHPVDFFVYLDAALEMYGN